MTVTAAERSFYTLSGAATPPYYTEAALYLLTPLFQVVDQQLWELLLASSPPYIFLLVALLLLRRRELVWRSEMEEKLAAVLEAMKEAKAEHEKEMERVEKERSREREQSQARLDATIKHFEARMLERDTLLMENTVLLTRTVELLNERQKTT